MPGSLSDWVRHTAARQASASSHSCSLGTQQLAAGDDDDAVRECELCVSATNVPDVVFKVVQQVDHRAPQGHLEWPRVRQRFPLGISEFVHQGGGSGRRLGQRGEVCGFRTLSSATRDGHDLPRFAWRSRWKLDPAQRSDERHALRQSNS